MANDVVIKFNDLPRLIKDYPDAVKDGIEATAREGERLAKQSMSDSPATGQRYGDHIASSEGNAPRIDTSNLVNNLNSKKLNDFLWSIRSGADYSKELEFGTRWIAPRPFMGPMAKKLQGKADDIMLEFLRDVP